MYKMEPGLNGNLSLLEKSLIQRIWSENKCKITSNKEKPINMEKEKEFNRKVC
jgi:hypothetical protein